MPSHKKSDLSWHPRGTRRAKLKQKKNRPVQIQAVKRLQKATKLKGTLSEVVNHEMRRQLEYREHVRKVLKHYGLEDKITDDIVRSIAASLISGTLKTVDQLSSILEGEPRPAVVTDGDDACSRVVIKGIFISKEFSLVPSMDSNVFVQELCEKDNGNIVMSPWVHHRDTGVESNYRACQIIKAL